MAKITSVRQRVQSANNSNVITASIKKNTFRRDLKNAIKNGLLDVHYQPQLDLRDGSNGHFEALIRWHDPVHGSISPATFVPVAEEMGLIEDLTKFVIDRVSHDLAVWNKAGVPIKSIAINISANHFSSEEKAERLYSWLSQESIPSTQIKIELTETAMLCHTNVALKYLQNLQDIGYSIALDDFGTGYASVAYLLNFPISVIKIDRSFVSAVRTSPKCQAIIRALMNLAHSLSLEVVAEGVEFVEEMRILRSMGCQFAQGYLLSKALPPNQVVSYLERMNLRNIEMVA